MGSFQVDDSRWPLVFAKVQGTLNDEETKAWFAAQGRSLERGERFATVVDCTELEQWTAKHRAANVAFLKGCGPTMGKLLVGCGLAMRNPVIRGAATAMSWISPFPHPIKYVATVAEAEAYARAQLAAAGIRVPAVGSKETAT